MSEDPFSGPASATGIQWDSLKGRLLLFKVSSHETGINTTFGEKDAIRADVVVLDGDDPGTETADTLVFPSALISQLKPKVGGMVLGRLGQGTAKAGQKPPWLLSEPTDADRKLAYAHLEEQKKSEVPF